MTRVVVSVIDYADRDYEVQANLVELVGITGLSRNRTELFDEIDRSVEKIKAAIEVNP